jgi:hypothetical protein
MIVKKAKEDQRGLEVYRVKEVQMDLKVSVVPKGTMVVSVLYVHVAPRVILVLRDFGVILEQEAIEGKLVLMVMQEMLVNLVKMDLLELMV